MCERSSPLRSLYLKGYWMTYRGLFVCSYCVACISLITLYRCNNENPVESSYFVLVLASPGHTAPVVSSWNAAVFVPRWRCTGSHAVTAYLFCLFIRISMAVMSVTSIASGTHHALNLQDVRLLWVQNNISKPLVSLLDQEYQRLKSGMESLLASNDEKVKWNTSAVINVFLNVQFVLMKNKESHQFTWFARSNVFVSCWWQDRRIEELTILLGQYRKMRDVMALTQGKNYTLHCPGIWLLKELQCRNRYAPSLFCNGAVLRDMCFYHPGSSEEELSGSLRLRAITHKAHSDFLRSEVRRWSTWPLLQPLRLRQ